MSIAQRYHCFKTAYPRSTLTLSGLRKLFKTMRIKRKVVLRMKSERKHTQKYNRDVIKFTESCQIWTNRQNELVQIDEAVFSDKGFQKTAWSLPGQNINISAHFKQKGCIAVVAAISSQRGLICHHVEESSINKTSFI